jgi:NADH-quinone oxidoreductase subunit L
MTRLWALTFTGARRGNRDEQGHAHAHESPWVMLVPLLILATVAAVGGLLNHASTGMTFNRFLGAGEAAHAEAAWVVWVSLGLALGGIAVSWVMYGNGRNRAAALSSPATLAIYRFVQRKWYMDDFYHGIVARGVLAASRVFAWFDRHVVNGFVDGAGYVTGVAGRRLRLAETGQLQLYALVVVTAAAVIGFALAYFGVSFVPGDGMLP